MEKLTLENIAPFLPYGVKFKSEMDKPFDEQGINPIHTCNGIIELFGDYCLNAKELNDAYAVQSCKPILRPMDLTKPITIYGKEVIPIVELAKMTYMESGFKSEYINSVKGECKGVRYIFEYYQGNFTASRQNLITKQNPEKYIPSHVYNVNKMFKWLYANFFDVDGLIEKRLAIDVNTLKTNPYN